MPPSRAVDPPAAQPLRVFLVEDSVPVRNMLIESLGDIDGLQLSGFADCEEDALEWLQEQPCDVLIVDLELKGGSGLGVLRALSGARAPLWPVRIVYSNHVDRGIRRLAERLGAAHVFDKTLETAALRRVLQDLAATA